METLPRNVWKCLSRLFPANQEAAGRAAELFREYESNGYLSQPAAQLIEEPLTVITDFFRRVSLMHSAESPILRRRDTRWMSDFDYTLVNIRAAGTPAKPGTFLTAAMFLTTLRTHGLFLAPVTRGPTENVDILESHVVLRDELTDGAALEKGIKPEVQMAAFCEAAHLLDLTLGLELDYHVDPLAAVVLNRPELFFWTKNGQFIPDEEVQDSLRDEVRSRVALIQKAEGPAQRETFAQALRELGLAAAPSADGSLRTPLAFQTFRGETSHREAALAYWGRVFDLWRDRYGFDFLILQGTRGGDDIPHRELISKAAQHARKSGVRRNIGVAAEADAFDVENYGIQGIDLVVNNDADTKADYKWFDRTFALDEKLRQINLGRKLRFSVPSIIDPGEKDSRPQRERSIMKRFVARFLGIGPSRRPLLETMGALEGAWGYSVTRRKKVNMGWMPDADAAKVIHSIEDVAWNYRNILASGERLDKHLGNRAAWWVLRSKRGLLAAIISVENEDLLPPEPFQIDYAVYLKNKPTKTVLEYDFQEARGLLKLSTNTIIDVSGIPYRGFRLYAIT